MPNPLTAIPEEDSTDFTTDEASGAIPTSGPAAVAAALRGQPCLSCGARLMAKSYALRRLAGHLYWRVTTACPFGHPRTLVFQTDWLRGGS